MASNNNEEILAKPQHTDGAVSQQPANHILDEIAQGLKQWSRIVAPGGSPIIGMLPDLRINSTPSAEEIAGAEKKVDGQIDGLLTDQQKQTLQKMQDSVLTGDTKGFADQMKQFSGNPDELKKYVAEVDKNLKAEHAGVQVAVDNAGNAVIYSKCDNKGVEIAADGSTHVREIEHSPDGTVSMTQNEVLNADSSKVAKGLGDEAVRNIEQPKIDLTPIMDLEKKGPLHGEPIPSDGPADGPLVYGRDYLTMRAQLL